METPKTLFLLVNYFNEDEVILFIKDQLCRQTNKDWLAIVIDNGSKDTDLFKSNLSGYNQVIYLKSDSNLGYFNAAAKGLDHFILTFKSLPEWIIVSNTDMEFDNNNFLDRVFAMSEDYDLIGPSVQPVGTSFDQNPFSLNRITKRRLLFLYRLLSVYPLYLIYQSLSLFKRKVASKDKGSGGNQSKVVYAIHGSCLIFRRKFFEIGGSLKYPSFLYEEELYVAEQARSLGLKTAYIPALKVIHHEHATTGTFKKAAQIQLMRNSLKFIIDTYYND